MMPERAEIEAVARALCKLGRDGGESWPDYEEDAEATIEALDRVRDARDDDEGARAMEIAGDIARDHARRFPDGEPSCSSCGVRLDQDNAAEDATCCDYCVAKAARSPQGEDRENCPDCWGGRPKWAGTMPAPPCPTCGGTGKIPWSPQREDHEVGIEAARQVLHGYVWHERLSDVTRATVAAYLSRVYPSRDGTVAVEDVGKRALEIAEGLRDDPQQERWVIAAYEEGSATLEGEPTPVCRVQGPSTSSQGVEVVPLGDLAWAIASAEFDSARAGESNER